MHNEARLIQTFLDLLAFNSPPGEEREVSRHCAGILRDIGFVTQHDAGGNLIARRGGAVIEAHPLFFSAHLDTVAPTPEILVRLEAGVFRAAQSPILGADDKAGAAAILEGVASLVESNVPTGDLLVILSTREEVGLQGARDVSPQALAGCTGYVLDAGGPTGTIIDSAPAQNTLRARIRGRSAHAGVEPEKGISALQIACRAVDRMPLGRIDLETTANCGILKGGTASNVVPEYADLLLEARSRAGEKLQAQTATMEQCLREASDHFGGTLELVVSREYDAYRWDREAWPIRLASAAWEAVSGSPSGYRPQGGGSDANIFNAAGIASVVLTTGYTGNHTPDEAIPLAELKSAAEWVYAIAAQAARPEWREPALSTSRPEMG